MDPDPGGPKTCGSGSGTLLPSRSDPVSKRLFLDRIHNTAPDDVVPGPVAEETVGVGDEDGEEGGEGPDHEGGQEVSQQGRYGMEIYGTWSNG
jgi:hypothetical protein